MIINVGLIVNDQIMNVIAVEDLSKMPEICATMPGTSWIDMTEQPTHVWIGSKKNEDGSWSDSFDAIVQKEWLAQQGLLEITPAQDAIITDEVPTEKAIITNDAPIIVTE